MNRKKRIGSLLIAVTIWAISVGCSSSSPNEVAKLLAQAKLSPLPPSATNVGYYQWNGLFTGETYAKFEMSAADLRSFISNSPCLQIAQPEKVYDTNYQHVTFPPNDQQWDVEHYDYFYRNTKAPAWYDPTVRGKGRKYVIHWGPYMEVLLNEERNIVWLRVVKG